MFKYGAPQNGGADFRVGGQSVYLFVCFLTIFSKTSKNVASFPTFFFQSEVIRGLKLPETHVVERFVGGYRCRQVAVCHRLACTLAN